MYPIKKLIVCLDQSPLDQTLIAFAGFIAKVNQVKKIYFANVIKNFSLPKEMQEEGKKPQYINLLCNMTNIKLT